jgi:hypothetical protein
MTVTARCRLYAVAWLILSVILYRLSWRFESPAHWRVLVLSGFFALSAAGLLLRVAWTYYALLTFLAYRVVLNACRLVLKLLGRYEGPLTAFQLVRFMISSTIVVVDLLDRDTKEEFERARPSAGDHAVCIAAGLAPLLMGWLRR